MSAPVIFVPPPEIVDSFGLYFEIPEIVLWVATSPDKPGREERFTASNHLMRRLDEIGIRKHVIVSFAEAGNEIPPHHVDALNHYLHCCRGLRSFKRVAQSRWNTKHAWAEFRERINFPVCAVIVRA